MSKSKLILLLAAVFLIGYIFITYFFANDEKVIRGIIDDVQKAVMSEDLSATFDKVSLEFTDDNGFKYLPARFIVKSFFDRTDQINLRLPQVDVSVTGREATATVSLILTGYSDETNHYILGSPENPTKIDISFKKGLTGWKIMATKNIRPSKEYLRGGRDREGY